MIAEIIFLEELIERKDRKLPVFVRKSSHRQFAYDKTMWLNILWSHIILSKLLKFFFVVLWYFDAFSAVHVPLSRFYPGFIQVYPDVIQVYPDVIHQDKIEIQSGWKDMDEPFVLHKIIRKMKVFEKFWCDSIKALAPLL